MTLLDDVDATVEVADGRLTMSDRVETGLYLNTPDRQPLGAAETHATLKLAGDDVRVSIDLNADALDTLADAVRHAQEWEDEGR